MRVFTALLFALLPSCSPATSEPNDSPATGGLGGGSGGAAGTPSNGGTPTAGSGGQATAGGGGAQGGAGAGSSAGGAGAGASGAAGAAGAGGAAGAAGAGGNAGAPGAAGEGWVGTWATAQQLTEDANEPPSPGLANSTLRQLVRVSIGGQRVRVRFSNEYGSSPVTLVDAHIATPSSGSAITEGSSKQLLFSGAASVTIPAKAATWSDALDFQLSPLAKLAVSIHFGEASSDITGHPGSRTTSYLQAGSAATLATLASPSSTDHWYILSGIDVMAPSSVGSLVILGDSITDGRGSTTNANDRWPDVLSARLQARATAARVAVLNQGIGGNAILKDGLGPTALARFDGDVLKQSGARWLIVFEGVNDIGADASASDLTAAYEKFATGARNAGLRVYGATILPFKGHSHYSENHEKTRLAVNSWIREAGHFDAVLDFDAAVRDPAHADTLLGTYDSGDHLHLNPAGYQKLGDAVDLKLFE